MVTVMLRTQEHHQRQWGQASLKMKRMMPSIFARLWARNLMKVLWDRVCW